MPFTQMIPSSSSLLDRTPKRLLLFLALCLFICFNPLAHAQSPATNAPATTATLTTTTPDASIAPSSTPWWDDYACMTHSGLEDCKRINANVGVTGSQFDPSWGIYGQRLNEDPAGIQKMHEGGCKVLAYFETFGTATAYIIELAERGNLDFTPARAIHWGWNIYGGGPIRWVGPQNYFDCEDFAGVYTRKHPRYGGPAMTYPDGTVATGYFDNETTNPLKSRVIDAGSAKNIFGVSMTDTHCLAAVNEIDPKTGKPKGPLTGLLKVDEGGKEQYCGHFDFGKDSACPMWIDLQRASILYAADKGLDGIWTDNFSPWDSFCYWPLRKSFGDWSVAGFRPYLEKNFSPETLKSMGVADVKTFNIRTALLAQFKDWGGKEGDMWDGVWNDARWLDHPLWRAYKIYKRQVGAQALTNFYNTTKAAAAQAGKPDFLVAGNDIPLFSLGWTRGDLDMVSTEMGSTWNYSASTRGITLPPMGRYSPLYKLAREHAKSRLVNIWFYIDEKQNRPGMARAIEYEMLANHALPMVFPYSRTVVGNVDVNAAFFKFVGESKATWGRRVPVQDVGLYYSSSSILAYMTPLGFLNMESQPHQFGYFGWGTALGELHYQYRPIPEWKLTPETLKSLRVLIIPDSEVFELSDVTNVLDPWVRAGGLLIVTGPSGARRGEPGNFGLNEGGLSLASLTGVSDITYAPEKKLIAHGTGKVLYLRQSIGLDYYVADKQRAALLPQFRAAMDELLQGQPPMVLTAPQAPGTAGLTLYEDPTAKRFFIDVNNMDLDPASDATRPTPPLQLSVKLPESLQGLPASNLKPRVLSPDAGTTVQLTLATPGRADLTITPVQNYASIVLEAEAAK